MRKKFIVGDLDLDLDFLHTNHTAMLVYEGKNWKKTILRLLKTADPTIDDIEVQEEKAQATLTGPQSGQPDEISEPRYNVSFSHSYGKKSILLPIHLESKGVQKLFAIAARIMFALRRGDVFVIDELESSIHPHLARFIVDLFQNTEANRGGQLIFTTHDTNLLDQTLLRRDQIWFVEKEECCSKLYPLLDFSPRKDENLEAGYLRGRYGAIPALGMESGWLSEPSTSNEQG